MDTDRIADHRLEIGFGGGIGGPFRFGYSGFAGGDVFETQWFSKFNGPYDDVTDYVADQTSITHSRGLDTKLQALEAGQIQFSVLYPSNISFFDPNNASSPLFTENPGFVPMRPVRWRSSYDNDVTWEGMFYGFISDAEYDPDTGICVITAQDLLYWMSRVPNPVIPLHSGITSSAAVGLILDSFDFSDPTMRNLSTLPSLSSINFSADGTEEALQLLQDLLDAEQGRAYIDGDGVFHFEDRYARDRRRAALYTFTTELTDLTSRASADDVGNWASITPSATGNANIAQDTSSEIQYGVGSIADITTDYITTDADAASLAALILKRRKDAHPPQNSTIYNESLAILTDQLLVELQDRITMQGIDGYVERIEHTLAAGGVDLQTVLYMSEVPTSSVFSFGYSEIAAVGDTTADYLAA